MQEAERLSLLTLVFAVVSLAVILILISLRFEFPLYPLVSYQDIFSILPPLIFIPLYWLLFKHSATTQNRSFQEISFMMLAALWVEGQGMHLSANSISNLINAFARDMVLDLKTTDIYYLTYLFDERLSHYLMHIGMIGLAGLLIYHEWRNPIGATTRWWAAILAGTIYGFTNFCIFIEGQTTAILGLPFCTIVVMFALVWGRSHLKQLPLFAFFFVTCLVALLLFIGWGLYWGGFPEFSVVRFI